MQERTYGSDGARTYVGARAYRPAGPRTYYVIDTELVTCIPNIKASLT